MYRLKAVICLALLSATQLAQAAAVIFDDVASGLYVPELVTPQGYSFSMTGFPSPVWVESRAVGGDQYLELQTSGFPAEMKMSDGTFFDLHQLDVLFYGIDDLGVGGCGGCYAENTDVLIQAKDGAGELIAETTLLFADGGEGWRTVNFDSGWSNIATLELGISLVVSSESFYGGYDNIVVTAVPIPAAVWLFGSALAGLGWMRRKQTA